MRGFATRDTRFVLRILGFDHGAGHPLLFLDDAKAPNCQKNNEFSDLGNYSEGIVSKPVQKLVGRLTLFQGISQVLGHHTTT